MNNVRITIIIQYRWSQPSYTAYELKTNSKEELIDIIKRECEDRYLPNTDMHSVKVTALYITELDNKLKYSMLAMAHKGIYFGEYRDTTVYIDNSGEWMWFE